MRVGSLGDIIFEVSAPGETVGDAADSGTSGRTVTPTEFTRERKARFETHQVIGALPRLEFLSPDLATVTMYQQGGRETVKNRKNQAPQGF